MPRIQNRRTCADVFLDLAFFASVAVAIAAAYNLVAG